MELTILKLGHPLLRQTASAVSIHQLLESATQKLIDDMIDTMRAASGAGLAAPQVGAGLQICVAEVRQNARYPEMTPLSLSVWVNPCIEVVGDDGWVEMYEGCLSVPGLRGKVRRPGHVRLSYLDRTGAPCKQTYLGPTAAVIGHECDHLQGVLFLDRADPRSLCFLDEFQQFVPKDQRMRFSAQARDD